MGVKKKYGAVGRGDTLSFLPETLKVITDPKHPLYDPRVEREPTEEMIASIMRMGVIVPLVIARDGEEPYVVDGRQRRAGTLEANKRLKKQGGEPILCPCVWRSGEDARLYEIQVATNEVRSGDSPLERARKMQHLKDMARDDKQIAVVFGVNVQTVRGLLSLLECDTSVKKAVESGLVAATIAIQLSKLPREEQRKTLAKMVESGATKGTAANKVVKSKGNGHAETIKPLSVKQRARIREALGEAAPSDIAGVVAATLAFVDGEAGALEPWPSVQKKIVEALMPQKRGPKVKEAAE